MKILELLKESESVNEDLRKWLNQEWVRFGPDGEIRGKCARDSDKEGKPKCLPKSKAQSLTKKERAAAARRKRREDPNPDRKGKAKNVKTLKEDVLTEEQMLLFEKKDACYYKVKSRYKVWPSAYASLALSKCRKVGADKWGESDKE